MSGHRQVWLGYAHTFTLLLGRNGRFHHLSHNGCSQLSPPLHQLLLLVSLDCRLGVRGSSDAHASSAVGECVGERLGTDAATGSGGGGDRGGGGGGCDRSSGGGGGKCGGDAAGILGEFFGEICAESLRASACLRSAPAA